MPRSDLVVRSAGRGGPDTKSVFNWTEGNTRWKGLEGHLVRYAFVSNVLRYEAWAVTNPGIHTRSLNKLDIYVAAYKIIGVKNFMGEMKYHVTSENNYVTYNCKRQRTA